jgi:hypothetical protein
MANAIKQVSIQKGHDATRYALQCFGGAGGQHACLVADELGMETVFIHPFAGVLSAYGMGLADQTAIREAAVEAPLSAEAMGDLAARLDALEEAVAPSCAAGRRPRALRAARRLHLRYAGTDSFLPVPFGPARDGAGRLHRGASPPLRLRHPRPARHRRSLRGRGHPARRGGGGSRAAAASGRRAGPYPRQRVAVQRRARACRPGARPGGAARWRPHRWPRPDPRGDRDHRGRARLDRRGDAAQPPAAAPDDPRARRGSPTSPAPTR